MTKKICERCQSVFDCGATVSVKSGDKLPCWCFQLSVAQEIPKKLKDCLCPNCLNEFIDLKTLNKKSITNEPDYYFDTDGLMVFSKSYHLKRGYCCGNGCRHCPY